MSNIIQHKVYNRNIKVTLINEETFEQPIKIDNNNEIYDAISNILQLGVVKIENDHATVYPIHQIKTLDVDLIPTTLIQKGK